MATHALPADRRLHHGTIRTSPPIGIRGRADEDHGLAQLGREVGLRTPDRVASPEMAEQTGMPIGVLRWLPLYVTGLVAILVSGIGLLVLVVL